MKLTKQIPARAAYTKNLEIKWIRKNWMQYSNFREYNKKYRSENYKNKCEWCNRKFELNDIMAFVSPLKSKNMLICQQCADKIVDE